MRPWASTRAEDGFSIIEVLVAATVLVVGVAGTLGLLIGANSSTAAATGTEGATNLAREVSERVRQLPFNQLTPATLATSLQAMSGLANTSGGPTWTVTRRGTTYTLTVDVCAIDDPKDGLGSHAGANFCATGGGGTGSSDAAPQDYQRVTVDASWQSRSGAVRHVKQVQMLSGRGADGPTISALVATSPVFPRPTAPIVSSTSTTTVAFKVTADARAAQVNVLLDGSPSPYGNATPNGNGTDWTFTLNVSAMADKSYEVAAQALDARGVAGPTFFIPLLLNRYALPAPTGVVGAMNTVYINGVSTPVAEISWDAEVNAIGYHVYRPDNTQACEVLLADDPDWPTSCKDDNPQDGQYEVAGIYQDAAGTVLDTARTKTSTAIIAFPVRTWFLDNHTNNDSSPSPCLNYTKHYDMTESPPFSAGGDAKQNAGSGNNDHRFCATTLAAPIKVPARTVSVVLYMKDATGGPSCDLTVTVTAGSWTTGPQTKIVTPASSITPYTYTWTLPSAVTLPAGARPQLDLSYDPLKACDPLEEHFNSTTNPSAVNIPTSDYPAPNPPTSVHLTTTSDGPQLDWTAPSSGITPAFYRIYRDGYNFDDRYDETEDNVPTWTDPDQVAGSHTYYVTAVSSTLQESDPAPLAPATFP